MMVDLGVRVLLAYLLGSLMGALIVGRLSGGGDIRQEGSGNAGGTNALRTRGVGFALGVITIDIGKGVLATTVLAWPGLLPLAPSPLGSAVVAMCCGAAAVLGHVFPLWFGFRGGKGAATLVGVYLGLAPLVVLPVFVTWIVTIMLTGYVGFATVLAGVSATLYVVLLRPGPDPSSLTWFGVAMALLLAYTHRGNIARMLRGTEDRKHAMMVFARRKEGAKES